MMRQTIIALILVLLSGCSRKMLLQGEYHNSNYYMDAPINIIYLEKQIIFSIVYPNVIGEKELGVWEIKKDTLILYTKLELKNNFQDTIIKNIPSVNKYLIKRKMLYTINSKWVFKKK